MNTEDLALAITYFILANIWGFIAFKQHQISKPLSTTQGAERFIFWLLVLICVGDLAKCLYYVIRLIY